MRTLLVDPSLFTAPYDAALNEGLRSHGVETRWAVRAVRESDRDELPPEHCAAFFYPRTDQSLGLSGKWRGLAKGIEHVLGMVSLIVMARREHFDIVHFQWIVVPLVDSITIWLLRRFCAVVLTVHDTVPFNGERISMLQNLGFDLPIKLASRVIVHTRTGKEALVARGIEATRIEVIEHGPLILRESASADMQRTDARYTLAMFGEIKPYKGLDLLVNAVAQLPSDVRADLRVVVAGRPRMDVQPVLDSVAKLGLQPNFDFDLRRLSEREMANLFASVDGFVFPYRQIDASGVYFLVKGRGKWLIASRVGIFAEDLVDGIDGRLVESGQATALVTALAEAVRSRPVARAAPASGSWGEIGRKTKEIYRQVLEARVSHVI